MVGVTVSVDIGDARLVLDKLLQEVEHPRGLLEVAGAVLENSIRDRFRTGQGPGGVPWPQSQRVIRGGGGKTLVDKGGLANSITHRADDQEVRVGVIAKTTSAKFAHVHQYGATIRPKKAKFLAFRPYGAKHLVFRKFVKIPARPFIGVDQTDREDLIDAWRAHLEGTVK